MPDITFDQACTLVEASVRGGVRRALVSDVSREPTLGQALARLRESLQSHVLKAAGQHINLARVVRRYDTETRAEGFHIIHDWDGKADRVNEHSIPVDVLDFLVDQRGGEPPDPVAVAVLLDYYLMYVLALLSVHVWDEGDANANLDRLDAALRELQGPHGSGQRFADDIETLMLIATSHYELNDTGYDLLLAKTMTLNHEHRFKTALSHASTLGSHLRFGFEATYARDVGNMRRDNIVDYPWLCFSLALLMREYARLHDAGVEGPAREAIVEAIINGLAGDAAVMLGPPVSFLEAYDADWRSFGELVVRYRADLLQEFERHRPGEEAYSPVAFFFNFSHNVMKGTVVDAVLWGDPWDVSFNDLLTGLPRGGPELEARETLAKTLMGYARANPDRIGGKLMPVIVYDSWTARQSFSFAMSRVREFEP